MILEFYFDNADNEMRACSRLRDNCGEICRFIIIYDESYALFAVRAKVNVNNS